MPDGICQRLMLVPCSPLWLTWEDDGGLVAFNPVEGGEELEVVDLHPLVIILVIALELSRSELLEQISQRRRGWRLDWALR